MKKILTMMAAAILFTISANAQPPEYDIDPNGTTCADDLEIKIYTYDQGSSTINGETVWFTVPSSHTQYSYSDLSTIGWVTDPGAFVTLVNEWEFHKIEVRNCNTPGISGTTGTNCMSKNLDGVTLENGGTLVDCFRYSSNCTICNSGQEIDVTAAFGITASVVINDM